MKTMKVKRGTFLACLIGFALTVLCVPVQAANARPSGQEDYAQEDQYAPSEELIENELSSSDLYIDSQEEDSSDDSYGIEPYTIHNSNTVDVTDLGADGTDSADDGNAIQDALNMASDNDGTVTVLVPAGTYYINKTLTMFSGTVLSLDSEATIIRSDDSKVMLTTALCDSEDGGAYGRASNLTVKGGVWDGNAGEDSGYHSIFDMNHCQNIDIENVTMKNWAGYHALGFHGSKNITVNNCTFENFFPSEGLAKFSGEAIHLDFVSEASGGNMPYDDTVCQDVLITGCSFINCHGGIGTHHSAPPSSNVTIANNSFTNLTGACVRLPNFHNVNIHDNTVSTARVFCYIYDGSSDITIDHNVVDCNHAESLCSNENAIYVLESDATITDNTITSAVACGITVKTDSTGVIQGNTLTHNGTRGILVSVNSLATISDNIITDNESAGIRVITDSQAYIRNNTIVNSQTYGIRVEESDLTAIQNRINENAEDGIRSKTSTLDIEYNVLENNAAYDIHVNAASSGIISHNTGTEVYEIKSANITDGSGSYCNHHYVIAETTEATCTENGRILYECVRCHDTYTEVLPMTGHQVVTDPGVAPTCTSTGICDGSHCKVCGAVLIPQGIIQKLDHTAVTDAAVAATCTKTGLTEGSHCSVCGTVITPQTVTEKLGHSYQWITDKEAGYGTAGKIHRECTRCGKIKKEKNIAASAKHCLRPEIGSVKKKSLKLSWNEVKDATKYVVYGAKCSKGKFTEIKTTSKTSLTVKDLKKATAYKYYVVAYHGKAKLTESYKVHCITKGGNKGNPTKIETDKTSVSIKKGKTDKIQTTVSAKKKVLQHTEAVRYYSANKSIAKINAKGKITAVAKGSCKIYAVAQDGKTATVKVTVK